MALSAYRTWVNERLEMPLLTVVIPAYNEANRIVPTIAAIAAHLADHVEFEIVVSDDGSTDGTPELVRSLGLANVIVIDPGVNRGKGAAVRAGFLAARGAHVLFSDADLSTPIAEIDAMMDRMRAGADVVIGSRAAEGANAAHRARLREALSAGMRRIVRRSLGIDVADTQCGFKLFRSEVARQLAHEQIVDGFAFDAELLFLASRAGYRVDEHPVQWVDAPGSKVSPIRTSLGFLRDLVRVRRAHRRDVDNVGTRPHLHRWRVAVVTAHPPSLATLTEYGQHMVSGLAGCPEVSEVIVIAEDSNGLPEARPGVSVVGGWRFGSITNPLRIARTLRRVKPDAVIYNIHFTSFASAKVPAALGLMTPAISRAMGIPTTVLLHNLVDTVDLDQAGFGAGRIGNAVLIRIGRALTRVVLRANHVGTTMAAYVDILRDNYGATNVYLAPHGSFDPPSEADTSVPDGRRRIMAFGKFGTYKRVDVLMDAFRLLQSSGGYDDVELVIAGTDSPNAPGYLDCIRAANRDLPNVTFTGYVAEEDVEAVFRAASVVVFPYTATTGSSGPLHQAGSYARAVVMPNVGDFIGLVEEEGYACEAFEPEDAASLVSSIRCLLDDDARREAMGRTNHAVASGLPLAEVVSWHLLHLEAELGVAPVRMNDLPRANRRARRLASV